jgi:hypothetical protein
MANVNLVDSSTIRVVQNSNNISLKSNANEYSTTETIIGTWINGKPLYRKVIETKNPVVSTDGGTQSKTIVVDTNIEFIYIESAIMISSNNTYTTPTMTMSGNRVWRVDGDIANKGFQIFTNNTSWSELPVKVIVRYTKTTD